MISLMQQQLSQGTLALAFLLALTLLDQAAGIPPAAASHFSSSSGGRAAVNQAEVVGFPHHGDSGGRHAATAVIIGSEDTGEDGGHSLERHRRSPDAITHAGKRITSNLVAELGKRPRELYSFGIGKRSISAQEMAEFLAEEEEKEAAAAAAAAEAEKTGHNDMHRQPDHVEDDGASGNGAGELIKRAPKMGYAFGLGKRLGPSDNAAYAFGVGKREYKFGMGRKRDPYAFGLGKRDPYSFGLGKRDPYAFGLGKRDPYAFGLGKRTPYGFGLGKRDPYSFGLGKRDPYSFGLGKRSDH